MSFSEKLTFQNAPSPQEFNEEDNADIICDVISSPPPTIIWKYKKIRIQPETDGKTYSTTSRSLSVSLSMFSSYFTVFMSLPYLLSYFLSKSCVSSLSTVTMKTAKMKHLYFY